MPLPVGSWTANTFPTAKSLNLALYTCDGTGNHPNGILFHAQPPLMLEAIGQQGVTNILLNSSPGGTRTQLGGTAVTSGIGLQDNAGYYGQTDDGTFWESFYAFSPSIKGGAGDGVTPGGWTIVCHFCPIENGVSTTTVSSGCDINSPSGTLLSSGARNALAEQNDVCAFFLDMLDSTAARFWPAVIMADSTSTTGIPRINTTDSSGETPRFFTVWAGVNNANQSSYGTQASVPVPFTGYTSATTVGTNNLSNVNLNGSNGILGPLNFLSNPPMFRSSLASTQSIANNSAVAVTLEATADVDNYSGYSSSIYTVQIPGLYLSHGITNFTANATGSRRAGLKINGGTTYWGPGYNSPATGHCLPTKTQIFSFQVGDTIQLITEQNSGGSLALGNGDLTRMFAKWMCQEGTPGTLWTPPDSSYRWQAGTPGSSLPALFQQHLANDLSFLLNRPYLMAYQTVAQTGFANNSWNTVSLDTVAGILHSDTGDNYSGWNSGTNAYVAQVNGWYLCVGEAYSTFPTTTTSPSIRAGFLTTTSGGRTPNSSPDRFQEMLPSASSSNWQPGATAIALYYLLSGESVTLQIFGQSYTSTTWGTAAGTGVNSHMEVVWVSN